MPEWDSESEAPLQLRWELETLYRFPSAWSLVWVSDTGLRRAKGSPSVPASGIVWEEPSESGWVRR